jgi:phosphomevalonate kinase
LKRAENPTFFCEKAIENLTDNDRNGKFKFWLITDARRRTDIDYFKLNFSGKIKTIRVQAVDSVREERNWKFTPGLYSSFFIIT